MGVKFLSVYVRVPFHSSFIFFSMPAMCFKKYSRSIVTVICYLNVLYATALYRYARCDEDPQNVQNSESSSHFEYNPGHISVDLTGVGPPKRRLGDFQNEKPKFTEHEAIREKGFVYVPHSNEHMFLISKNVSVIPEKVREKVPENTMKPPDKKKTIAVPGSKTTLGNDRPISKKRITPPPIINTDKHTLLEFQPAPEIPREITFEGENKIPSDYICQDHLDKDDQKLELTAPFPLPTETSIEDGTSPLFRRGSHRHHHHHHPLCNRHRRAEQRFGRPIYENQPYEGSYFGNRDGIADGRIRIFAVFRRRRDTKN